MLDSIPIMGHGEGGGSKPSMFELIENRMEVIQKSDVAVSKLLGAGGYGEVSAVM